MHEGRTILISEHAVTRWQTRVDRSATRAHARSEIQQMIEYGRVRATPRRWTTAEPGNGRSFLYWVGRPDVCAVIVEGTVVTVLTRPLCTSTPKPPPRSSGRREQTSDRWRWDGADEEAA